MAAAEPTCRSIMMPQPPVLRRQQTVAEALRLLLDHHLLAVPIVEADGRYFGMFARSKLISLLLPRAVGIMETSTDQGRWLDFGYLPDTLDDLRARYQAVAGDPVDRHALLDTPKLRPDTPLMNALLFLYRNRSLLPVVEEGTGKLLGVVSTWDALARIAETAPGK
jgi:CBS domain-containing protein